MLAAGLAVNGCSDGCINTVVARVDAPDGSRSATMFERNCGATTSFSTQISILAPGKEPSGGGNVFIADADHGVAAPGHWGGPRAEIRWIDNATLLVRYASGSRIFAQARKVSGVSVRYQEIRG